MSLAKRNWVLIAFARLLGDALSILAAYYITSLATLPRLVLWADHFYYHLLYLVFFGAAWFFVAADQRLFVSNRNETLVGLLFSVSRAFFLSMLFSVFLMALLLRRLDQSFLFTFELVSLAAILAFRLVMRVSLWNLRLRGFTTQRIVLVGANKRTARLAQLFLANEQYGYHIVGFLEDDPELRPLLETYGLACLGEIRALEDLLVSQVIDGVYISLPLRSCYERIRSVSRLCEGVGVPVRLVVDFFPLRFATGDVRFLGEIPLLSLSMRPESQARFALKNAVNAGLACVLLVLLSPVMAVLALLIKLTSRGPVFVRRRCMGPESEPFDMLLFRTTEAGAPGTDTDEGARRTRVGRFLHWYGLDELPQLINVVAGQMSLGGPRPPAFAFHPFGNGETDAALEALPPSRAQSMEEVPAEPAPATAGARASRLERLKPYRVQLLSTLDSALIVAAYVFSVLFTRPVEQSVAAGLVAHLLYLGVFVLVWFLAVIERSLFSARWAESWVAYLSAVMKAAGDAIVFCVFVVTVLGREGVEQGFLVIFCFSTFALLLASRGVVRFVLWQAGRLGYVFRRVLLIGANERSREVLKALRCGERTGCRVEGLLEDNEDRVGALGLEEVPYLGGTNRLESILAKRHPGEVYVTLPLRSQYESVQDIARRCEGARVTVHLVADLFPMRIASRRLLHLDDIPLLSITTIPENHLPLALKRLGDFVVASMMLAALSPVFALVALLIKLESRGPVFYAQERVGQNQRRFKMLKFRSMVADAERLLDSLRDRNEADGPVFKIREDPRVTRVGRYLRRFSIDEFPQLINVWLGQMSLVGPRPPIPAEVEQYTWDQRRRLSVKPGMTGLWQVSGRSDVGFSEWVQMDLAYIDTWSLVLDFSILLRTFKAVVSGRGAA